MIRARHLLLIIVIAGCTGGIALAQVSASSNCDEAAFVGWPVGSAGGRVFDDNVAIVEPEHCAQFAQVQSTLLTYSDQQVQAWEPGTLRPIWNAAVDCPYRPRLLFAGAESWVFATHFEIFSIDRRRGAPSWRIPVTPGLRDADDLVDSEQWVCFTVAGSSVIAGSSRGELLCIDADSGRRQWHTRLEGRAPQKLLVSDRSIFVVDRGETGSTLRVIDLADGKLRSTRTLAAGAGTEPVFATSALLIMGAESAMVAYRPEGESPAWSFKLDAPIVRRSFATNGNTAVWLNGDGQLVALDLETGRRRWQIDRPCIADTEWIVFSPNAFFVVAGKPGMLVGIETERGRICWRHSGRALPFAQPPVLMGEDLLTICRLDSGGAIGERLFISRIGIATGMTEVVGPSGSIVTEPLQSFGGLTVRNNALILLDGQRMIDYVPGDRRQ